MELDTSSIEKRFAFGFLQQLLRWMDISQEFIAHLGRKKSLPDFHVTCKDSPGHRGTHFSQLVFTEHQLWTRLCPGRWGWMTGSKAKTHICIRVPESDT